MALGDRSEVGSPWTRQHRDAAHQERRDVKSDSIERVLGVIRQEMGCEDTRVELGGRPPDQAEIIWVPAPGGVRLVAVFETPPSDRRRAEERLRQLGQTFFESGLTLPAPSLDAEIHLARRRLDDELAALAGRTGAVGANVIDMQSPMLWGCSESRYSGEDLETFVQVAEVAEAARARNIDLAIVGGLSESDRSAALDELTGEMRSRAERLVARLADRPFRSRRNYLLHGRALAEVRRWTQSLESAETSVRRLVHGGDVGYFARSFAGIYVLVLYFQGPFSELHVEGTALHYLPVIERHVLGLPPVDPEPPGGKVLKMKLPVR